MEPTGRDPKPINRRAPRALKPIKRRAGRTLKPIKRRAPRTRLAGRRARRLAGAFACAALFAATVPPATAAPAFAAVVAPALPAAAAHALPAAAAPALVAAAQETPSDTLLTVDHYLDWERVGSPRISPDGSEIIYTRSRIDKMNDRWDSELWIMNADGTRNRFLVEGSSPRWSPDGTRIAYLAEGRGEDEGRQVFVRWMDAEGATSQITHVTESPSGIRWSPDGTRIAFTMLVPAEHPGPEWTIDLPARPEGAEWTRSPRIVERLHYRQDGRGFQENAYRHLFVVPADGGSARRLTQGEWNVGARFSGMDYGAGFDWTPDGRTIVFDGLMADDADERYRESHLYAVDVTPNAAEPRQITSRRGPWSGPVVSPDGRWIAYTGYDWTAQTYRANELYLIRMDGSDRRRISGDLDRDPNALRWASDGGGVYFTADDRGSTNVWFAAADGSGPRQVTEGEHDLSLVSATDAGTAVGERSAPHEPGDVVAYDLRTGAGPTELTHVNDDVLAGIRLGEVEEIWYESTGGARVQGWIVKPPSFDVSREYPLVLHIHGGPHAMYDVGFSYTYQNLAANGYVVLYTNPRGSTGYGTEFGNAIDNGYPSVDYDDLMAGVDAVIDRGYIDTDNMFVTGCSGGGVLSSWVIGHTDRFAAAAVRCPVINWMSFAGTTDIAQWGYYRYEGYPWTNPDKYLHHSPLMYAGEVTTPTAIMTGELDLRTPMAQSEEYYAALKSVGVPTALVRFHDEYHGTGSQPSNYMRTQLYLMKWFERFGTHDEEAVAAEEG